MLEASRIVLVMAWATLVAGGIAASRYAGVRQHRGAVFTSTIGQLVRSRVATWWIAIVVGLFVLAGLLHALARLTG